jgi:hypothetical protein
MLPGFRFLVAAIVFSFSIIVFGLGAAALFRAAHEQFASSSSWRATPETSFTTFLPQAEPPRPMIAMLRIESVTPEPMNASPTQPEVQTDLASTDTVPDAPAPAETSLPVQSTASEDTADADVGTIQVATTETTEAAPPTAPPVIAETVTPALSQPDSATAPLAISLPSPTSAGTAAVQQDSTPKPDVAAPKLASLGDQPAAGVRKASLRIASVQLHRSLAKKRLAKARLAKERLAEARRVRQRQMAQRAHAARDAATAQQQQQYADPFAQQQGLGQSAFGQQTAQRTR